MTRALALALLAAVSVPSAGRGQTLADPDVVLRGHALSTSDVLMASEVEERLSLWAPDGLHLLVRDAGPLPEGVERLGSWAVTRMPRPDGGVSWHFAAPVIAWSPGDHVTPPLRVTGWTERGDTSTWRVDGIAFSVASPLPPSTRRLAPAPAQGPPVPGRPWPGLLAVLPVTLVVGTGLAWWRSGRREGRAPGSPPSVTPSGPTLASVLAHPPEDPGALAVAAALAARSHPRLTTGGVGAAHTTAEVLRMAGGELQGVGELLHLADWVRYGGGSPDGERVRAAAIRAAEVLDRG